MSLSKMAASTIEGPSTRSKNGTGRLPIRSAAGSMLSSIQSSAAKEIRCRRRSEYGHLHFAHEGPPARCARFAPRFPGDENQLGT